jgi:hypothetical protein
MSILCVNIAEIVCAMGRFFVMQALITVKQPLPLALHVIQRVTLCHHAFTRSHPLGPGAAVAEGMDAG